MKITWGKNAKTNRQPSVAPSKPGLPFGVDSDNDETEKEETRVVTTDCPGTKPSDNAESLKNQGNRLAEVSFFSFLFFSFLFFSFLLIISQGILYSPYLCYMDKLIYLLNIEGLKYSLFSLSLQPNQAL